jgi:hypothetical protein
MRGAFPGGHVQGVREGGAHRGLEARGGTALRPYPSCERTHSTARLTSSGELFIRSFSLIFSR